MVENKLSYFDDVVPKFIYLRLPVCYQEVLFYYNIQAYY